MLKNSIVYFAGNMLTAFGGLILTIIVARLMGPYEYGIFGSLLGLMYFLIIPVGALDILITKTVSSFKTLESQGNTKYFLIYLSKKLWLPFALAFLILLLLTIPLKTYLHLESGLSLVLMWFIVYMTIIGTVISSAMKGLLNFFPVSLNIVLSMLVRILSSLLIIFMVTRSHFGGLWGLIFSGMFSLGLFAYQLKKMWASKTEVLDNKKLGLRKLGIYSLLISGAFTAMYSLDIIFVRHYLSGFESGIYASLATAGKMIFFAISPIAAIILPVVSRKVANPDTVRKDLLWLSGIVLAIGLIGATAFYMFPRLIINTIFSDKFDVASIYLPVFGLVMLTYSLSNVFGSFLIGLNKYKSVWIIITALAAEIILLNIFHKNIFQVIFSMGSVFLVQSVILFGYCWYATRKTN